jgi:NADH dehydrogenase
MTIKQIHTVTGAFGYSGKYIAQRLLDKGHTVQTITNSVNRQPVWRKDKGIGVQFRQS